jgi:dihydrofolate reductase
MITIIAAVAANGVIGSSITNDMPWRLPADLKHFKKMTDGSTVVMGSATFKSLPGILPNRKHVVVSRDDYPVTTYRTYEEVIEKEKDFFVIGGGHLYKKAFKHSPDRLMITRIVEEVEGDICFPFRGDAFTCKVFRAKGLYYEEKWRSPIMFQNGLHFEFIEYGKP